MTSSLRASWDLLDEDTQAWLIAHNGEEVPAEVLSAIPQSWLSGDSDLRDEVTDWIEAVANGEDPDV